MHAPVEFADIAADVPARIRERAPRVHCITDAVAQQYTANMLLAAGAGAIMDALYGLDRATLRVRVKVS